MKGVYKHGPTFRVNTTINRERVCRSGFPTRAAAEQWLAAKRANPGAEEPGQTVRDVIAFYLEHRVVKTQERQLQLAEHVNAHLGDREAASVRQADVDDYTRARETKGAAPKTAWNELGLLRAALRYGWRNDLLPSEPRFILSKPVSCRRRVAWQDEIQRLWNRRVDCQLIRSRP